MYEDINTTADLMRAAGDALNDRDMDAIARLMQISANWLQGEEEADAQRVMLDAMLGAIDVLESLA
jgi:hypothetical protein